MNLINSSIKIQGDRSELRGDRISSLKCKWRFDTAENSYELSQLPAINEKRRCDIEWHRSDLRIDWASDGSTLLDGVRWLLTGHYMNRSRSRPPSPWGTIGGFMWPEWDIRMPLARWFGLRHHRTSGCEQYINEYGAILLNNSGLIGEIIEAKPNVNHKNWNLLTILIEFSSKIIQFRWDGPKWQPKENEVWVGLMVELCQVVQVWCNHFLKMAAGGLLHAVVWLSLTNSYARKHPLSSFTTFG